MRVLIIGAGAIGGLLAARLVHTSSQVTVLARGENLEVLQRRGLTLIAENGDRETIRINAIGSLAEVGPQDLIVLAMKSHQVAAAVDGLRAKLTDDTMVLTAQNGIPWWYFHKHGGAHEGRRLESVDPGGVIAERIPIDRVVASVVYPAADLVAPGTVRHVEGNRISVGEIDNSTTPRINLLAETLRSAGFKAPVLTDVRGEIWVKLWGNLTFNPVSALTHATLSEICGFPLTRALAVAMMQEAQVVAERLGVHFRVSIEKRVSGAAAVGAHKTSMLQDVEEGRAIEIEALLGAVVELARITSTPTPHIDSIYACARLLAVGLDRQQGRLRIERKVRNPV